MCCVYMYIVIESIHITNLQQIDTVCLQYPFLYGFKLSLIIDLDTFLRVLSWVVHVYLYMSKNKFAKRPKKI